MGKRLAKHLRKVQKLRDTFTEELIVSAGLLVRDEEVPAPAGASVIYLPSEMPGFSHIFKVEYVPPMYVNVQKGSEAYSALVKEKVVEGQTKLAAILNEEGIMNLLQNEHIFASVPD